MEGGKKETYTDSSSYLVMFIMSVKKPPLVLAIARLSLWEGRVEFGKTVEREQSLLYVFYCVNHRSQEWKIQSSRPGRQGGSGPAAGPSGASWRVTVCWGHSSTVAPGWWWYCCSKCCSCSLLVTFDLHKSLPEQPGPLVPGESAHSMAQYGLPKPQDVKARPLDSISAGNHHHLYCL